MTVPIGLERIGIRRGWEWAGRQPIIELTGRIITRRVGDSQEDHSSIGRSACWAFWPTKAICDARVGWTPLKTCGCNSMVEYLPSKQATWVRFPSPALLQRSQPGRNEENRALHHERVNRGFDLASGEAANASGRCRVLLLGKWPGKAAVAQLVERVLGKDEVLGSNPSGSSGSFARTGGSLGIMMASAARPADFSVAQR